MTRKKLSQHEWLERRLHRLIDLRDKILAVDSDVYGEPEYGFWSLKKEIALMYCIWPFLQIAKKYFESYHYLDLFAGSGMMKVDEKTFFVGSPIVALGGTPPDIEFNSYVCFEIEKRRAAILETRLKMVSSELGVGPCKVFKNDCNEQLPLILKSTCNDQPDKTCFLAFVDPEGFEVRWDTIQTLLKHCKGDLLLTFQTSGILRNIERAKKDAALAGTLTSFFGCQYWRELEVDEDAIVRFYMSRLNTIDGKNRTTYNIEVKDEKNHRLYDIILATGSTGMSKVISDLKQRLDRIRTRDIRSLSNALAGQSTQLDEYLQYRS